MVIYKFCLKFLSLRKRPVNVDIGILILLNNFYKKKVDEGYQKFFYTKHKY